jgi:glycerate 2-kinase
MPLRILIVPDKFKGTLTAGAAAKAIARGWGRVRPQDKLELLPMSDGGDGFGEVMSALIGAVPQMVKTCDAAHRPCRARWWWGPRTRTAIIESAEVIGLAMLPPGKFHPFELDSYGLGPVLRAVVEKGAQRCLVGLGGSATNDAGFGLARALGWQFLKRNGRVIESWIELQELDGILPGPEFPLLEIIVAVDVQNPLLGPRGATRIYGPQKGLKPADFRFAEDSLAALAAMCKRRNQDRNLAPVRGVGAAGGLGFGFLAFVGGRLERGFDLFAREARLQHRFRGKDLVLTGEGAIDDSTFMGKGAGQIAMLCRKRAIPCIGLAGQLPQHAGPSRLFKRLCSLTQLTTVSHARREPAKWLERLATRVAETWPDELSRQERRRLDTRRLAHT